MQKIWKKKTTSSIDSPLEDSIKIWSISLLSFFSAYFSTIMLAHYT